jgi:hypothetical protein
MSTKIFTVLFMCFVLSCSSKLLEKLKQPTNDFCWRDYYVLSSSKDECYQNQDKIGNSCVAKCPSGTSKFGFDCHQDCPNGWRNDGLFCRLPEYGRGSGFPWKFGDPVNDSKMFERCEKANGKGNCEKSGQNVYPKCKKGFSAIGCCICRPNAPNCKALGFTGGIGLSCSKNIIINKLTPLFIPQNQCKTGYTQNGHICLSNVSPPMTYCGIGSAISKIECEKIISNRFENFASFADNIYWNATSYSFDDKTKYSRVKNGFSKLKTFYSSLNRKNIPDQVLSKYQNLEKFEDSDDYPNIALAVEEFLISVLNNSNADKSYSKC